MEIEKFIDVLSSQENLRPNTALFFAYGDNVTNDIATSFQQKSINGNPVVTAFNVVIYPNPVNRTDMGVTRLIELLRKAYRRLEGDKIVNLVYVDPNAVDEDEVGITPLVDVTEILNVEHKMMKNPVFPFNDIDAVVITVK